MDVIGSDNCALADFRQCEVAVDYNAGLTAARPPLWTLFQPPKRPRRASTLAT